jgi:hypothetical protein
LGLPHVQIEGIVEAHNFGSQTFALKAVYASESAPKDHVVLRCENISRAELISLVNIQVPGVLHVDASVLGFLDSCSLRVLTCDGLHDLRLKCLMNLPRKSPL